MLLFYKEALHNARSHAKCSHIDILLRREPHALILNIKDNGEGMDEETLNKPGTMRTLKHRAEWLKADLRIKSSPGEGTELALYIPI